MTKNKLVYNTEHRSHEAL